MESGRDADDRIVGWLIERELQVAQGFFAQHASTDRPALLLSDRGGHAARLPVRRRMGEGAWRAELDQLRRDCVVRAPRTGFIHARPEVTAERKRGAPYAVSGLQTEQRLRAAHERRLRLAREHGDLVIDSCIAW